MARFLQRPRVPQRTTAEKGSAEAYAVNMPNYYYDCDGLYQPGEQDEGNEFLDSNVPQVQGYAGFMWWLDD